MANVSQIVEQASATSWNTMALGQNPHTLVDRPGSTLFLTHPVSPSRPRMWPSRPPRRNGETHRISDSQEPPWTSPTAPPRQSSASPAPRRSHCPRSRPAAPRFDEGRAWRSPPATPAEFSCQHRGWRCGAHQRDGDS